MTTPVSTLHLIKNMQDARNRTLELVRDLDEAQIIGPKLPIVNPLRWEIGHVAHFYEYFILRQLYNLDSVLGERADQLYDSIAINHEDRWDLDLPTRAETLSYMQSVFDRLAERLVEPTNGDMATEQDSFIYQFGIFHEDMHTEAFLWARQALAYPTPDLAVAADVSSGRLAGGHPGWARFRAVIFYWARQRAHRSPSTMKNVPIRWLLPRLKSPRRRSQIRSFKPLSMTAGMTVRRIGMTRVGPGARRPARHTRCIGSPTDPANGCCDGSTERSLCLSTNPLFTSAGTKQTPIAAGLDYGCRQRRSGKWRPSASQRPAAPWPRRRDAIPGATSRLPLRAPTSTVGLSDRSM